jgi:hypothetical protein
MEVSEIRSQRKTTTLQTPAGHATGHLQTLRGSPNSPTRSRSGEFVSAALFFPVGGGHEWQVETKLGP